MTDQLTFRTRYGKEEGGWIQLEVGLGKEWVPILQMSRKLYESPECMELIRKLTHQSLLEFVRGQGMSVKASAIIGGEGLHD